MTVKRERGAPLADAVDEELAGHRDDRGNWAPHDRFEYPPVFVWPPQPLNFLSWSRSYVVSWHLLYATIALTIWLFLTPSIETTASIDSGWPMWILVRNAAITTIFCGAFHLRLYVRRAQGEAFKYKPGWPRTDSNLFLFRSQTRDNVFWTLCGGVPIWTAFECLMLWAYANGHVGHLAWPTDAVWIVVSMVLVPVWRDPHFFATHRLLHTRPLYQSFHKIHHNNTNPGPWSGLAMHPVEHALYFSLVLIHFVVPTHPVVFIFELLHAGLAAGQGHLGFDKVLVRIRGKVHEVDSGAYNHYLHHKHFECNYSEGVFPLDKWFGTFNDGSPEGHAAMKGRMARRAGRASATSG